MPNLIIIAGPNGAGKSTHSKDLLTHHGIEAFDLDKEFYAIWSQFGYDPSIEHGAFERAQNSYIERRTHALHRKENFAFETNYHSKNILPVVEAFKTAEFKIELVFILLESPETATERVNDRVAKGGHFVDETIIHERFGKGLGLLDESFQIFDFVSIYLSKPNTIEAVLSLEPYKNKATPFASIPVSLAPHLPKLSKFVQLNS